MNETVIRLLDDCVASPGVLGCGVRLPDRTCRVRCCHVDCPESALERAMSHLANSTVLLASYGLAGHRLVWKFSGGTLLAGSRPDGALFCLVTQTGLDLGEFFDQTAARILAAV